MNTGGVMFKVEDSERLIGATVLDPSSDRIGEIRQVFVDADTEEPAWVGVRVGLFGGEVLVPLDGADWDERALHATVTRTCARSAPEIDLDEPLSVEEHERVCRHYGIPSIRHPREDLDPAMFEGPTVSYSVKDDDMVDADRNESVAPVDAPLVESRDLGEAMETAADQRSEGVSGHMLDEAPRRD